MTAQIPDKLHNHCDAVDLRGLHLYGVLADAPARRHRWGGDAYHFAAKPIVDRKHLSTALWRGHVSVYRLAADGAMTLEAFEYPFHRGRAPDPVDECLRGDFWLMLARSFSDFRVYVPFRDGRVVADRAQWRFETDDGEFASGSEFPPGYEQPKKLNILEKMRREHLAKATATLIVRADASLVLADYTLYVDRNRAGPGIDRGVAGLGDNSVHIRLLPGSHTVTLREGTVHKPDRLVSNTLEVEFSENEQVTVRATWVDATLSLQVQTST